ncbi:MAG TPA: hypothetical protein VFZ40_16785 [Pyrinomonadaceae bacterium]
MKKTTQPLLLVFGTLLLLVSVTVSAQGQPPNSNNANFTGVWNTITDKGEKLVITLRHDSSDFSVVIGSYHILGDVTDKPPDGGLKGSVKDKVFRFTWSSHEGRRAGRFTLSSDGESFEGTYSATKNPDDTSGGTWKATRAPKFAGAWQASFGGSHLTMLFQQTGDRVTGQLNANSADLGVIRDGKVVDNTLRFTVMRRAPNAANLPDVIVGYGELVMEKGGKSLKGTVLGVATSGTLIGR